MYIDNTMISGSTLFNITSRLLHKFRNVKHYLLIKLNITAVIANKCFET